MVATVDMVEPVVDTVLLVDMVQDTVVDMMVGVVCLSCEFFFLFTMLKVALACASAAASHHSFVSSFLRSI